MRSIFAGIALSIGLMSSINAYAFTVPVNDGFITDSTGLLTKEQEQSIEQELASYREQTSNEIAIVIVKSMDGESIMEQSVEILRKWGVGSKANNNGLVLLVAYEDRDLFLTTGYGLEGAIPDLVANGIIQEDILPYFREGQYFEGILNGITSIQKHIGGEYGPGRFTNNTSSDTSNVPFFLFIGFQVLVALLARTKSWWLGGILGLVLGIILAITKGWLLSIPFFTLFGFLLDFVVSKMQLGAGIGSGSGTSRRSSFGSRGGGGFGGFGGGSGGGGGARGRW